jgi:CubicO group peptidase (beta-lactamase class C family)
LAQLFLSGGQLGQQQFFSRQELDLFTRPEPLDSSFGLGWRLHQTARLPWFSALASPQAFGHTGWTGVVTVIDPQFDLVIVLLTNKKHSPVVNPAENPDRFLGDTLPLGSYTPLVQMVYEALE